MITSTFYFGAWIDSLGIIHFGAFIEIFEFTLETSLSNAQLFSLKLSSMTDMALSRKSVNQATVDSVLPK